MVCLYYSPLLHHSKGHYSLEEEVNAFLGRERYERGEEFRGYRNGYHRSHDLTVGVSAVAVKVPRGYRTCRLKYRRRVSSRR